MSKGDSIYTHVARKIAFLESDNPKAGADLAKLRRAVGKDLIDSPEVWEIVMGATEIPCEVGGKVTKEGQAIHVALTLYGLYRQGKSAAELSRKGRLSFGQALAKLETRNVIALSSLQKRYNIMTTHRKITKVSEQARTFIRLFSASGIQLDFALLAKDLYNYQWPEGYKSVRIRWASEFYANNNNNNNKDGGKE